MTRKPSASQLYKQFEKAEAAYRAIPEVEEKPFERAVDRAVLLIAQTPADTIGDMLLKILGSDWGQTLWSSMQPNLGSAEPTTKLLSPPHMGSLLSVRPLVRSHR